MAANMGQVFAFAAVFVFVITTLGSSVMWGVDADAEVDDQGWKICPRAYRFCLPKKPYKISKPI
jgi:hypothetical protein